MATSQTSQLPNQALELLDDLIKECYEKLKGSLSESVKIGDFLKMIEFRRKLAPGDADQKKFWKMLDDIRKEKMAEDKQKSGTKKTSKGRNAKKS